MAKKKPFIVISENILKDGSVKDLDLIFEAGGNKVFAKKKNTVVIEEITLLIDGYVLPRNDIQNKYPNAKSQPSLIVSLYKDHGHQFVQYIKGVFNIVICSQDSINIYNDQLGIKKYYYSINNSDVVVSNSFDLVTQYIDKLSPNYNTFAIKAILNREISGETIFGGIFWSKPATSIFLEKKEVVKNTHYDIGAIQQKTKKKLDFQYFADLLQQNISTINQFLKPKKNAITLTGGKDSRTALTALLSLGIKPVGLTYGSPESRDAVYAGELAKRAGIEHKVVNPDKSADWFESIMEEMTELDNPLINIHRSHRYFAFKEMVDLLGNNSAYYAGYMGGEFLMGIYYDNLIFTKFLTDAWEQGSSFEEISPIFDKNFIRTEVVDRQGVEVSLNSLRSFDESLDKKQRQFFGLFEIGVLHHSQDLQLASEVIDFPIPFLMDIEFLEALFSSQYSFLFRDNKTKNLFKRYKLFEFNLNIQHLLYPDLDSMPFAKRGTYNTKEFLAGSYYWTFLKTFRYFTERKKYPATFAYDEEYKKFMMKWLNEIVADKNSVIHSIYDVQSALNALNDSVKLTAENQWHSYSNIVMHYLQFKKYLR